MARFIVTALAEADLLAIHGHIAQSSERQAGLVVEAFYNAFALLADHPKLARAMEGHEFARKYAGRGKIRSYVFVYRPIEDGVEILQIIHGSRNQASVLRGITDSD